MINTYNIEGNGYADDCSALYGGPRLDIAINRLQKMLDSLTAWGRRCGLKFNPDKSVAVVFTRRQKTPPKALVIDGKEIAYKQEVKYLGVTLDSKLHWKAHINDKVHKAKRFISHVAQITRKNWGPKPKLMRWAYLGIVRPMMCYGAMIWGHRAQFHTAKLSRINRMGINTFGSFPRSTPTAALEIMLDITPLHHFCLQEGLSARCRLHDVLGLDWPGTAQKKTHAISHLRHWENIMQAHDLRPEAMDRCSRTEWSSGYRLNRDSFDGTAKHRHLTQYNIFTDGSRIGNCTGAGFAIYKGKREILAKSHKLPDHATVFQAEITAIRLATRALLDEQPRDLKYVKFFVDSRSALQALENPKVTSRAVADTIQTLNLLGRTTRSTTLNWIPAHRGLFGNERADSLAKLGTISPDQPLWIGKPPACIKSEIKNIVTRTWTAEWTSNPQATHTKHFYSGPDPQKAKYVYKLARLELGRFVRLITGHNNLNYFQHRLGLWGESSCRFCHEANETFLHLVTSCPRWHQTRIDFFLDKTPCNDMGWSVRTLLDFSYTPRINAAFEGTSAHWDAPGADDLDSSDSVSLPATATPSPDPDLPQTP